MQSFTQLLFYTLVDKHVSIDSGTQCEYDTCDTRHGECRLERCQYAECEEEVEQQCAVGQHARYEVVEQNHDAHQQHEGHDERYDTLLYGLGAERGTYHLV